MKNTIDLNKLPMNKTGKIEKLNCNGSIRRRFLDLGMIKGTNIRPILRSPSKYPIAYEVRCSVIALRQEDAQKIEVEVI